MGVGLGGVPVLVDTAAQSVVALVGDPASGKTTLARHLTRWWSADPGRTARVFADQEHQYRDLAVPVAPIGAACTAPPAAGSAELMVLDGADSLSARTVRAHADAPGVCVITSYGPTAQHLEGAGVRCLGLVGTPHARAVRHPSGQVAEDLGQGRLDWPAEVQLVLPDRRGAYDLPRHRWQPAAGSAAG